MKSVNERLAELGAHLDAERRARAEQQGVSEVLLEQRTSPRSRTPKILSIAAGAVLVLGTGTALVLNATANDGSASPQTSIPETTVAQTATTTATSRPPRDACAKGRGDGWTSTVTARAWLTSRNDEGCELRVEIDCTDGKTYRGPWVALEGTSTVTCPHDSHIANWTWMTRKAQ